MAKRLSWLVALFIFGQAHALAPSVVLRIVIDGAITPVTASFVKDAVAHAEKIGAKALLIELDTPGGLYDATQDIVKAELASHVPVIVYVMPSGARAGSAGVFITMAAKVAAMAPTTHIGAAHPVGLMGGDVQGHMAQKIENDAAAFARSLAETNGRNALWAEKAVRQSVSISDREAIEKHVVDLIAKDVPELLDKVDGKLHTKGATIETFSMTGRQRMVGWLSNPNLLYLLMLFGFLGIFIEFQVPGHILPGVLGVACLAIVFGVQILPINWMGMLLLFGAVALFIAEIYLTTFGLLGVLGVGCLVFGSYLLFDVSGSTLRVDPVLIWVFSTIFAGLMLSFGYVLLRAKRQGPTSGVDAFVGSEAEVFVRIAPGNPGTVHLQGAYWPAHADEILEPGTRVVVLRMRGTEAFVKRA